MNQTVTNLFWYKKDGHPCPFYVDESIEPVTRLAQHRRDAADPLNGKDAYEFLQVDELMAREQRPTPVEMMGTAVTRPAEAACTSASPTTRVRRVP